MILDNSLPLLGERSSDDALAFDEMAWAKPQFPREAVNSAGGVLVSHLKDQERIWTPEDFDNWDHALEIINNWRASHGYPLNTFQVNLRTSARRFDTSALIAQRTKRLSSIASKLQRFPTMKLSQMQDIGGCRAVLRSVSLAQQLATYYLKESGIKHPRASVDDYVSQPKDSGYRGIHLVYRYFSDKKAKENYNGLKIEMQIRSRFQHAWATAVETVGTFVQQALKSSIGQEEWLRFFALMGSAIAMRERQPLIPDTPTNRRELIQELRRYATTLDVAKRLRGYGEAMRTIKQQSAKQLKAHYYLLELDAQRTEVTVTGYKLGELTQATDKYLEVERAARDRPGADAVLVSVESLTSLERAYPNYFADTTVFVLLMQQALAERRGLAFLGGFGAKRAPRSDTVG